MRKLPKIFGFSNILPIIISKFFLYEGLKSALKFTIFWKNHISLSKKILFRSFLYQNEYEIMINKNFTTIIGYYDAFFVI